MKRCPQCNRTYTDDALSFCLDDGSPLVSASAPSSYDPSATIQYPQSRDTTPQPTIAYGPGQAPSSSTPPPPPPPQWSPMPPTGPQKRSVWPWILGIGAVLAFMGIGVVILIIALASMSNNNNNKRLANANSNNNNSRWTNRNSNANAGSNANARSDLSSYNDDFSSEQWRVGTGEYGRTWYEDEEFHMNGTKGRYILMYGPDRADYNDENATVRVTVKSVDGDSPTTGYGLLVHGQMESSLFRDYGFLIYNGSSPKYAIVQHKNSVESKLVPWTSSSAIRTGTTPNQLEVRIRDRRLDFYINGQFITSITDSEGFNSGRVGFCSSDSQEVAFDDLEISR
jgi:hypothetical protein